MSAPGPMKDAGSAWPLRSEMPVTTVRLGLWLWKALDAVKTRKLLPKTCKAARDSDDRAGHSKPSQSPTPETPNALLRIYRFLVFSVQPWLRRVQKQSGMDMTAEIISCSSIAECSDLQKHLSLPTLSPRPPSLRITPTRKLALLSGRCSVREQLAGGTANMASP